MRKLKNRKGAGKREEAREKKRRVYVGFMDLEF